MKAAFENGRIMHKDQELNLSLLEAEEETKYWEEFSKQKLESLQRPPKRSQQRRQKRTAPEQACETTIKAKR